MNDYTYEISHLLDAKYRLRQAKSQIKADEERAALVAVAARIQEKQHEADLAFAKDLALAHAKGVPQTVLRKQVLRTNDWGTWVYWRDLAKIEPDRVQIAKAKEATAKANAHFLWHDTTTPYTFDVVKDQSGLTVTPIPAKVEAATPKDWQGKEDFFAEVSRGDYPEFGGLLAFQRYVNAEVKRAFEAGEIPEIISEYDALQRAKKNNDNA